MLVDDPKSENPIYIVCSMEPVRGFRPVIVAPVATGDPVT